jgi:type IV pilus assembly protein PilO
MRCGFRELIFVALMLGMLGSTYWFVFKPDAVKRTAIQTDMAAKKSALSQLRLQTAGVKDLEKQIAALEEAIAFFEDKLPKASQVDDLLEGVNREAKKYNLNTKVFRPLKIENYAAYSEQPIQMTIQGSFTGFYSFLLDLERLSRIVRIGQMKINKIGSKDGDTEVQMTLSIFFEREAPTGKPRREREKVETGESATASVDGGKAKGAAPEARERAGSKVAEVE